MTGLGIVTCLLVWTFLGIKYNIRVPSRGNLEVFAWVVLCVIFVAYTLLRFTLGRKRRDELTSKVLEKLVRVWQRVSGTQEPDRDAPLATAQIEVRARAVLACGDGSKHQASGALPQPARNTPACRQLEIKEERTSPDTAPQQKACNQRLFQHPQALSQACAFTSPFSLSMSAPFAGRLNIGPVLLLLSDHKDLERVRDHRRTGSAHPGWSSRGRPGSRCRAWRLSWCRRHGVIFGSDCQDPVGLCI